MNVTRSDVILFAMMVGVMAEVSLPPGWKPSRSYTEWYLALDHVHIEPDPWIAKPKVQKPKLCKYRLSELRTRKEEWDEICDFVSLVGFGLSCEQGVRGYFDPALSTNCTMSPS